MHRSGTSLAAAMLCTAGATPPIRLMPADVNNELGYWEPWPLAQLNEELLADLGLSWDSTLPFPVGVLRSPTAQSYIPRFAQLFATEYGDSPLFCVKDPRNSRLLPVLLPALSAEAIEPKYVIVARNPLEVAQSLRQRDGFHWSKSLMLWMRYTLEAEEHTRGQRRVFVTYDQLMGDWRTVLERVGSQLNIGWPRRLADIDLDFEAIIADRLRHHKTAFRTLNARKDIVEWVRALYGAFVSAARDSQDEALRIFDRVREALGTADFAFEPLLADSLKRMRDSEVSRHEAAALLENRTDELSATQAEYRAVRKNAEDLLTRIAEQQAHNDDLLVQLQQRDAELSAAHAELDAARGERDSAREQASSSENGYREQQAQADDLIVRLRQRDAEMSAAQAELEAMRAERDSGREEESATRPTGHQAEAGVLAAQLKQREHDLTDARNRLEGAIEELSVLRAREGGLSAAAITAEESLADLEVARRQAASAMARAANRQAHVELLFTQLQQRDGETAELKIKFEAAQGMLASAQSEIRSRQNALDELRAKYSDDLTVRQGEIAALGKELGDARSRAVAREYELHEQLRSARAELANKDLSLTEVRASMIMLEAQSVELTAKFSQAKAELAVIREELAEREDARDSGQHELQKLKSKLTQSQHEVEQLEADLSAAREVADAALSELERMQRDLAASRADSSELRTAVQGLETRLKSRQGPVTSQRTGEAEKSDARFVTSTPHPPVNGSFRAAGSVDPRTRELQRNLATSLCNILDWKADIIGVTEERVSPATPIGVFVHIYYDSLAGEIAATIKRIPYDYRVYVSTGDELRKARIEAAFAREGVGNIVVKVLPNAGRDIGPFLFGFRDEVRKHDVCLRLHSKKSGHSYAPFGTQWRRHLLRELLDTPERVAFAMAAFASNPEVGILAPTHWEGITRWVNIGDNWSWLRWLLDRIGVSIDPNGDIEYPSGSMFWFRSAAMEPLLALDLTPEDFADSTEADRDSSLAHGVERAFFFVGAKAGFRWAFLPPCKRIAEPPIDESIKLVRDSGLFDPHYYLARNKDVAETGADPLDHFVRYGAGELRNPSAAFDMRFYARLAEREFGWTGNPLIHYLLEGRAKELPTLPPRKDAALPSVVVVDDLYGAYKKVERGTDYVQEAFPLIRRSSIKPIAFYFPQYHPFAENDRFWGRGFTEWTNTTKAQPLFPGHYQPRLPGELGFYDTRIKDVLARQIELAKQYGIYGFCFHHYFFESKPVMRAPFNQMLAHADLDIPFCLHWANEPWTVRWDGLASESGMLLDQRHSPQDDLAFFDDIAPALTDRRYITIDGRPLLIVYRPGLFPDMGATIERWKMCCARLGLKEPYLAVMQAWFEGAVDPRKYGFDAAIEYPPHNLKLSDASGLVNLYDRLFGGNVRDYAEAVEKAVERETPPYTWFRGIIPDWDCTPRRADPDLLVNADPKKYRHWLEELCRYSERALPEDRQFIFINAWNEWAEGAYLEPDRRYGYGYLDATARALNGYSAEGAAKAPPHILLAAHIFYLDLLDEFLDHFERVPIGFDLFVTVSTTRTNTIEKRIRARLGDKVGKVTVKHVKNIGRDGAPFVLHALPESQKYDLCCWVHSKKSAYDGNYAGWRGYLLDNLLGSSDSVRAIIAEFTDDSELGMLFPKPFPAVVGKMEWGSNYAMTADLLSRLDVSVADDDPPFFAQGTMFWFRPKALEPILGLGLQLEDFERDSSGALHSSGTVFDGTISHALERMLCIVTTAAGFTSREFLNEPYRDNPQRPERIKHVDISEWRIEIDASRGSLLVPASEVGVFVHIRSDESADGISSVLRNIRAPFRAYVSTTDEEKQSAIARSFAREGLTNIVIKVLPGADSDIDPLITGFKDDIRKHEIGLWLHTEKGKDRAEPDHEIGWRRKLLTELIGSRDRASLALDALLSNPELGMLIPEDRSRTKRECTGDTRKWFKYVLDRLNVSVDSAKPIDYPYGSMFWFKSAALEPLLDLNLDAKHFDERRNDGDFGLAQGIERAFLFSAASASLFWAFLPPYRNDIRLEPEGKNHASAAMRNLP